MNLFEQHPAPSPKAWKQTAYHITQTERKAILTMLNNRWTFAHNRNKTKLYSVVSGTPRGNAYDYVIEISTRERTTIGADVQTTTRKVPFQHTINQ
jgi:hypothetical protein